MKIYTHPYKNISALKRLGESLNATNVLSDDYAKEIFNMACIAYGEGYKARKAEEADQP